MMEENIGLLLKNQLSTALVLSNKYFKNLKVGAKELKVCCVISEMNQIYFVCNL